LGRRWQAESERQFSPKETLKIDSWAAENVKGCQMPAHEAIMPAHSGRPATTKNLAQWAVFKAVFTFSVSQYTKIPEN
jgi:hypothetical protein